MSSSSLPFYPRILASNAHKYIGKNVLVTGEVTSITPHANTFTLRMPDDENIIVLLQKNSTTIEPHMLTEVAGKLVSRGQIESWFINQFDQKDLARFNNNLFAESVQIWDAHQEHYNI